MFRKLSFVNKIALFFCFILITSCTYEKSGIPFTHFGNNERTNYYDFLKNFPASTWLETVINDSSNAGIIQTPLALNKGEFLIACSDGTIRKIQNNRTLLKVKTKSSELICSNIAADKNENFYAITLDGDLNAFSKNGENLWVRNFRDSNLRFQSFSDLLVSNKGIYLGSNSGLIAKIKFDGTPEWQYKSQLSVLDYFAANENDDLLVGLTNTLINTTDTLICFKDNGSIKWSVGFPNFRLIKGSSYSNGNIFVRGYTTKDGEKFPKLYCLNSDGKIIWEQNIDVLPLYLSHDAEGNSYLAGFNSGVADPMTGFYKFDKNGKLIWKNFIKATIVSELMISKDISIFAGSTNAGIALFYLQNKDGINYTNVPLGNYGILYPQPSIGNDGSINFGGADNLSFVSVTKTQLEKLLPF